MHQYRLMIGSRRVDTRWGDVIAAEVAYGGGKGQFTVTRTHRTTHETFSTSTKCGKRSCSLESGTLPLADFGTAFFRKDNTSRRARVSPRSGANGCDRF